ncbi:SH3 domain-containing YSC84-like protein 1 [Entomortierella parvispora]|uniref:SH3 domain-containing YSC84-like protein 1 n=1 Tax=Entomortierella parvispora TaxID=205924 RepID=A0A9P3H731_9FUNG|nr:SH3 domain-containing YSC84-like protein 1 [Entomortierella parvispora]
MSMKKGIKLNSPLPKDLAGECKKASKILNAFIDPVAAKGLDNIIPANILSKAKGLAIFTVIKAGFMFSGRAGTGVVVARLEDGSWSAPSAIGTGGMGFGGQIGAEITDFVMVLNSREAVKSFTTGGNITLGGNLSVAAGPIGRTAEAGASATVGSIAAIYSYSKTKGLFAGVSIEGSVIVERKDTNEAFYRQPYTAAQLLSGVVPPPPEAEVLYRALDLKASRAGYGGDSPSGSAHGGDFYHSSYTGSPSSHLNRNTSTSSAGRFASPQQHGYQSFENNGYNSNNGNPNIGRNRTSTSTGNYGPYGSDNKSRQLHDESAAAVGANTHDDPAPRYTPTATSNPFQDRAPPAPPRMTAKPELLTAMYDFVGEQATDLSFKKGDRITVVKKTDSTNDWWTGRIGTREGSFPRNYCQ